MAVFPGPEMDEGDHGERPGGREGASRSDDRLGMLLLRYYRQHRGKFLGVVIGLWVGFGVMFLGVLWTLFVSLCVAVGYFVGRRLDDNQEDLLDFLDRVLPPGRR